MLALHAAYEVWELSEEERLAAKALASRVIESWRIQIPLYHQQYLVKVPHGYRCHSATGVPFPADA